ncbi:MAG: hypothetical protein A3J48_00175 [Candidatus Doudnabacteria bacterium RIFCSPHIGHO2_02_FULL_46_11]|uniref:DAGKc domain-containing protein n=1 Tax=Candidatus Doudnabacteria bacterium RIFCSPHIGHO2_02_FULL_46_11 TaxID=1817832 RepID=A0A1F5P7B6_9BACT|nr:MAG: hypothetical protein A3J48_00175 [Candidatus Doudnabacteria bacterium RIFCSPHIGHO2_02_FULL_46_11]
MYHYIIDQTRIQTRNFDRLLGEVYGFLTEYQIGGEVHRVTRLRNVPELVDTARQSGAKTIVAIGDDNNFLQLLELLAEQEGIVLGYIPLVSNTSISHVLGVRGLEDACQAIAKRRVEDFDIGLVGRNYFFTRVDFGLINNEIRKGSGGIFSSFGMISKLRLLQSIPVKVSIDGRLELSANIIAGSVINARGGIDQKGSALFSPHDGKLDLLLLEKRPTRELIKFRKSIAEGRFEEVPGSTVLHGRNFEIEGPKNFNVLIEQVFLNRSNLSLGVSDKKIRVIVGKGRRG